jgi:SAM-dependent methyltransferase
MPMPVHTSDHYGDADKYFSQHSIEGKLSQYDRVIATIEELGAKPGRLLDIGAGRGELLCAAKARGWEAVGIEPASAFAAVARRYSGAEVFESRLEDHEFEADSFDVVTLGAVLEHVFNPVELLTEIGRVLRPGGKLWLDVPNEMGTFFTLGNVYHRLRGRDWVVNLSPTFPPFHVFGFTPRSIKRLLNLTGFDVVRLQTYATPAVLSTDASPVSSRWRPLISLALHLGERIGMGTYMDAWATRR